MDRTKLIEEYEPPVKEFFEQVASPKQEAKHSEALREWLKHQPKDQKIAWSGGTLVPLEKNMVRFIDNFSGGTRGSSSAECFIEHGYSVIFLHRHKSIMPFQRHFIVPGEDPLSRLSVDEKGNLVVDSPNKDKIVKALHQYNQAKKENRFIAVPFSSIFDYFFWMKRISELLQEFDESRALFYSAAAVSDFYLKDMAEHKIQSSSGPLTLTLDVVPKLIPLLKPLWIPRAMIITFKLETDISILDEKVGVHLYKYGADLVIGNILGDHTNNVYFCQDGVEKLRVSHTEEDTKRGVTMEDKMIAEIAKRHTEWRSKH